MIRKESLMRENLDESSKEKLKDSDKKRKSYCEKTLMKAPKKN